MIVTSSVVTSVFGVPLVAGLRVVLSPTGGGGIASNAFIIGSGLAGIGGRVRWADRFFAVMVELLNLHRGLVRPFARAAAALAGGLCRDLTAGEA